MELLQDAFAEAYHNFRWLAENTDQIFWVFAPDFSQLFYISPTYERVWGRQTKELYEEPAGFLHSVHPGDRDRVLAAMKRLQQAERVDEQFRIIRPDGSIGWILARGFPILKEGRVCRLCGISEDITRAKKAEKTIRESDERFRLVAKATNDTIWDWNPETNEMWWNDGLETVFGYRKQDVQADLGWWMEHIHPEDLEGLHDLVEFLAGSGEQWSGEYRFRRADGGYADILDRGYVIRDGEGRPIRMLGCMMDISERKRHEQELTRAKDEAEAANRAKSEFLANVSHEIRTPMNGIIAMTELALDSDLSVEQRDYLETVKISADALLRTINGILDYSKIEARDFTIEPARFVLCQVVSALLQRTRLAAREKGLKLSCDIDPDIPRKLIGDGPRLQQVLFNLIENAIKFTCAGQVTLSAQLEAWTSGACRIRFAVTDTGIGISSDHLNLIFQPFRQVDGSTTRRYGGTGLGLTICSQLVASMGGEISVQSKPGEGSTFEFALEFPAEAEVEVCCCQLVEAIE